MNTSPAVIKPEAVRPFAPKDALALPGHSFCLQNQACNFPSPLLLPLSPASPAAQWQEPVSLVTARTADLHGGVR